ncbi:MAG: hypothetical protein ACREK8_08510 [Gemmatimonadales bacterium]
MTTPVLWTLDDLCAAADEGVAWLANVGIARRGTRFEKYSDILAAITPASLDDSGHEFVKEVFIGIVSLFWMSRAGIEHDPGVRDRLRLMVQGRAGDAETAYSAPWDAQFELLCLAIARIAQFPRVLFAEPDLLLAFRTAKYGLPIKRLTSDKPRGWQERVKHGVGQLDRVGVQGIVIVEAAWPGLDTVPELADALDQAAAIGVRSADRFVPGHRLDGVVMIRLHAAWRTTPQHVPYGLFAMRARFRSHNMTGEVSREFESVLSMIAGGLMHRLSMERPGENISRAAPFVSR